MHERITLTLLILTILGAYAQEPIMKSIPQLLAVLSESCSGVCTQIHSVYLCSGRSRKFTLEGVSREGKSRRVKPPRL